MKIELQHVSRKLADTNKKFSTGAIVNRGSLEFALSAAIKSKNWQEQVSYVIRALLCDHVFEDGNKRTAAAYLISVLEEFKYRYDPFKIDRMVLKIAKNNTSDVKRIRRMIQNAAAKNF